MACYVALFGLDVSLGCFVVQFPKPEVVSSSAPLLLTVGKLYVSSRSDFAHRASFVHPWKGFLSADRSETVAAPIERIDEVLLVILISEDLRVAVGLVVGETMSQSETWLVVGLGIDITGSIVSSCCMFIGGMFCPSMSRWGVLYQRRASRELGTFKAYFGISAETRPNKLQHRRQKGSRAKPITWTCWEFHTGRSFSRCNKFATFGPMVVPPVCGVGVYSALMFSDSGEIGLRIFRHL